MCKEQVTSRGALAACVCGEHACTSTWYMCVSVCLPEEQVGSKGALGTCLAGVLHGQQARLATQTSVLQGHARQLLRPAFYCRKWYTAGCLTAGTNAVDSRSTLHLTLVHGAQDLC